MKKRKIKKRTTSDENDPLSNVEKISKLKNTRGNPNKIKKTKKRKVDEIEEEYELDAFEDLFQDCNEQEEGENSTIDKDDLVLDDFVFDKDKTTFDRLEKTHENYLNNVKKSRERFETHKKYTDTYASDSDEGEKKKKKTRKVYAQIVKDETKNTKRAASFKQTNQEVERLNNILENKNHKQQQGMTQSKKQKRDKDIWSSKVYSVHNVKDEMTDDEFEKKYVDISKIENIKEQKKRDEENLLSDQKLFYQHEEETDKAGPLEIEKIVKNFEKSRNNYENELRNNGKDEEEDEDDDSDEMDTDLNGNKLENDKFNILRPDKFSKVDAEDKKKTIGHEKYETKKDKPSSQRQRVFTVGPSHDNKEDIYEIDQSIQKTTVSFKDMCNVLTRIYSRCQDTVISDRRGFDNVVLSQSEIRTRAEEESYLRTPRKGERPCVFGEKCEGNFIPGAIPITLVEFLDANERRERRLRMQESNKKNENGSSEAKKVSITSNPCVMCYRLMAQFFYAKVRSDAFMLSKNITLAKYYNIVDEKGEYCSRQCYSGNGVYWQGLPGPVVMHVRKYYKQTEREGCYYYIQQGYSKPGVEELNTPMPLFH